MEFNDQEKIRSMWASAGLAATSETEWQWHSTVHIKMTPRDREGYKFSKAEQMEFAVALNVLLDGIDGLEKSFTSTNGMKDFGHFADFAKTLHEKLRKGLPVLCQEEVVPIYRKKSLTNS